MDDKLLERMLDNLIEEAGPIAIKNMESNPEDVPEVEFSKEHEEKMKKIFAEARKEMDNQRKIKVDETAREVESADNKVHKRKSKTRKFIILAAALILALGLVTTSSGWRESFMKYFLDMKDEYSDVKNVNPNGNSMIIENIYFGYIPEGFKYEVLDDTSSFNFIEFINEDKYFILKIIKNKWSGQVNTEGKKIEDIVINNKDMIYYENDNEKCISWQEDKKTCVLTTNLEKEILLEIAEKIKIAEETSPQN